jgi:hypothetical protein
MPAAALIPTPESTVRSVLEARNDSSDSIAVLSMIRVYGWSLLRDHHAELIHNLQNLRISSVCQG